MTDELLQAIELAPSDWDAAHRIVQGYEDDRMAEWIHAVLHKTEGDLGNSRYWYHRAGRLDHAGDDATAELQMIKAELTKQRGTA